MGPERRLNAVSLLGASPPTKPVSLMSTIAVVAVMAKPWECERGTQKKRKNTAIEYLHAPCHSMTLGEQWVCVGVQVGGWDGVEG